MLQDDLREIALEIGIFIMSLELQINYNHLYDIIIDKNHVNNSDKTKKLKKYVALKQSKKVYITCDELAKKIRELKDKYE